MVPCIENPYMIDFGKIVILGREPKDRHSRDSARVQVLGQPRRRKGFVYGVRRTGEQSDLLTREDRYGSRLRKARDENIPRILGLQDSRYRRPPVIWINTRILDLARCCGIRFPIVRIVRVKARNPIKMVSEIGEKLRGSGDFSVT